MAQMIPETIRSSATVGERLLFNTLKDYLPDDYIVYYEPDINGKIPYFVIIGPDLGLIVLEVKDYTQNTLLYIGNDEWTIRDLTNGIMKVKNPLKQAREYAFHISDKLKKDKNLIHLEGKYQGNLVFPFGYGTVFTRLKQEHFIRHDIYSVIQSQFVLVRDEIDPDDELFAEEILMEKLIGIIDNMPFALVDEYL